MAVTILIRKGTKAQLDGYGALSNGELAWITDEKKLGKNSFYCNYAISYYSLDFRI